MSMSDAILLLSVLESIGQADSGDGVAIGSVAWDLCVDEKEIAHACQRAIGRGLIEPAEDGCYRLTGAGRWAQGDQRDVTSAYT